jgi:hypothetical protein
MSVRAELLASRRQSLLVRSEALRREIGADASALAMRFRFADKIVAVGRSGLFKMLFAGGASLLLFGRTRRILSVLSRLAVWYPLLRRAARYFWTPAPAKG